MTMQHTLTSQIPAQAGVASRAALGARTMAPTTGQEFCTAVRTPDAGGVLAPNRRPPIE